VTTKTDVLDLALSGGVLLWDCDYSFNWDTMPAVKKEDWLIYFDMLRDEPTVYTERIISSIEKGLCPEKGNSIVYLDARFNRSWTEWQEGRDFRRYDFWFFRSGKDFSGDTLPDTFAACMPTHRYNGGDVVEKIGGRRSYRYRKTSDDLWFPIWKFNSLNSAWKFILKQA